MSWNTACPHYLSTYPALFCLPQQSGRCVSALWMYLCRLPQPVYPGCPVVPLTGPTATHNCSLTACASSSQPFWHQGLVFWKAVYLQAGVGCFQDDPRASQLLDWHFEFLKHSGKDLGPILCRGNVLQVVAFFLKVTSGAALVTHTIGPMLCLPKASALLCQRSHALCVRLHMAV